MEDIVIANQQELFGRQPSQDMLLATQGLNTSKNSFQSQNLGKNHSGLQSTGQGQQTGGLGPQELKNLRKNRNRGPPKRRSTFTEQPSPQENPVPPQVVPPPSPSPPPPPTSSPTAEVPSPLDAGVRVSPSRTVNTPDIEEPLRRQALSLEKAQLQQNQQRQQLQQQQQILTKQQSLSGQQQQHYQQQLMSKQSLESQTATNVLQEQLQSSQGIQLLPSSVPESRSPVPQPPSVLPPPRRMPNLFEEEDDDLQTKKAQEQYHRKYLEYQVALKNAKSKQDKNKLAKLGAFFDQEDEETARRRRLAQQSKYRQDLGAMSHRTPSMPSIDEMGYWDFFNGEVIPPNKENYRKFLEEQMRTRKRDDIGLQFMAGFDLEDAPAKTTQGQSSAIPDRSQQILQNQADISRQVQELQRVAETLTGPQDASLNSNLMAELSELEQDLQKLESTQQNVVKTLDMSKSSRKLRRVATGNDSVEAKLGLEVQQVLSDLEQAQHQLTDELQGEVNAHKNVIDQEVREFENWLQQSQSHRMLSSEQKMELLNEKFEHIQQMEAPDVNHINDEFKKQFADSVERAMQLEAQRAVEEQVGKPILADLLTQLQQLQDEAEENEHQLTDLQNDIHTGLDTLTHNVSRMEHELSGHNVNNALPHEDNEIPEWIISVIEDRFVEIEIDEHADAEVSRILTPDVSHNSLPQTAMGSIARKLQRQLWMQERNLNGFDMWEIVKNMAKQDGPSRQRLVDASQSYAVGAVLQTVPVGLPVTFTVYTVLEDSSPCISGGANIVAFAKPYEGNQSAGLASNSMVQDNAILHLQDSRVPGNSSRPVSQQSINSSEGGGRGSGQRRRGEDENPRGVVLISQGQLQVIENDLPMEPMEGSGMPQGEGNRDLKRSTLRNLLTFNWLKKHKGQHSGRSEEDRNMVTEAAEVLQRLRDMQAAYWGPKNGIPLAIRDLDNGSYYITGHFADEAFYEIHVLINQQHIHGSPFKVQAVSALHVGSGFGTEKLIRSPEGIDSHPYNDANQSVLILPGETQISTNPGWEQLLRTESNQRAETVGGLNRSRTSSSLSQQEIRRSYSRPQSAPPRAQRSNSGTPILPSLLDPNNAPLANQVSDQFRLQYARNHPCVGNIDLVFLVDGTASMMHELNVLADQLPSICQNIENLPLCKSLRIALLLYGDHHQLNGSPQVVTKVEFTNRFQDVAHLLDQYEAKGGGDYPEAMEYALDMCGDLPWRENSSRMAVILGDAPPHGYQGLLPTQAVENQMQLEEAKENVMNTAGKLEKYIVKHGFKQNKKVNKLERELEVALNKADYLAQYYDEYSRGAPGGHLWQEAAQKLSDLGVTVVAFGFREVISHEPSQACLRAIAHMTHGALLDLPNITDEAMNDFIVSTCGVLLSRALVLEELVDLALSTRSRLTQVNHEVRMAQVCHALNAVGCHIATIEGHFAQDGSNFVLGQKSSALTVELLFPVVRSLTQKSNVVMNGLARQYVNDPMRWVVDAWTQVQRDQGLHDDRMRNNFNQLEMTLIRTRQLQGPNISPFDLRYVLAHAILSSGY